MLLTRQSNLTLVKLPETVFGPQGGLNNFLQHLPRTYSVPGTGPGGAEDIAGNKAQCLALTMKSQYVLLSLWLSGSGK